MKQQERQQKSREKILSAAMKEFAERGYEEVTVDSITVVRSKSGDLSYFDDVDPKLFKKEDLLVSTTKRYMRGNVNMEIIFDVSYLEIYADGGLETASVCVYPDAPYQVVSTDGDLEVKMYTIKK